MTFKNISKLGIVAALSFGKSGFAINTIDLNSGSSIVINAGTETKVTCEASGKQEPLKNFSCHCSAGTLIIVNVDSGTKSFIDLTSDSACVRAAFASGGDFFATCTGK